MALNLHPPKEMDFTASNISDSWNKFKKSFNIYANAIDLFNTTKNTDAVRIGVLLHCMGEQGHLIFENIAWDNDGDDKKYEEVVKKFDAEFNPVKSITYERFKFNSCMQTLGQTFEDYITELKKLSNSCEFGELRDSLLRDRVICGIRDNTLRERLLRQEKLDLPKTIQLCKAAEITAVHVTEINSSDPIANSVEVNELRRSPGIINSVEINELRRSPGIIDNCKFCGESHSYGKAYCPAANKHCERCNKVGHISRLCYSSTPRVVKKKRYSNKNKKQINNLGLQAQEESENSDADFFIGRVLNEQNCTSKDWTHVLNIEDNPVQFKLDTGAQCNVLSQEAYDAIKTSAPHLALQENSSNLISFTGEQIKPKGKVSVKIKHGEKEHCLNFLVAGENCLLGLTSCIQLDLIRKQETPVYVDNINATHSRESLMNEFKDVFTGLGCLPTKHKIVIKEDYVPGYTPPRHFPELLRNKVKSELD